MEVPSKKPQVSWIMIIKLMVDGGEMKPGPTVGQQLGPVGINIGEVIKKVNQATSQFKGTKVPIALDINTSTKEFTIKVSSPPTSELLKKEFNLEKGAGDHKKEKVGNASIEQIISVAKTKHSGMLAREFKSAVKSVIGSAISLGILVESKEGKEITQAIDSGQFDSEIKQQKTDTSPEKKAELKAFFEDIAAKQAAAKKVEEEAAKAAEEAKTAAATPAAPGATPAATPEGKAAPAAKAAEAPGKAAPAKTAKPAKK